MTSGRFRNDPDFEILGELGRGGMGVVFRARQRSTGRDVALKVVFGALTQKRRERFLREGQTTANLHHPGIVRIHASGEMDGCPYLAYELVPDAKSLTVEAHGKDLDDQVELVRDAAVALGHAHANGVVHRDVKPANLLVAGDGTVKVADFGLALAEGVDRLTRTGELMGTPHYMPPEAFAGTGETGPPADVWSLGVILFEVVSGGELPFEGEAVLDLAVAVTRGRAPALTEVFPEAPADLVAICRRALEPKPEARYPDGAALADDLAAFLAGEPPPGIQRSSRLLIGVVFLVLLLNGLLIGALVARNQRGTADPGDPTGSAAPIAGPTAADPLADARRALQEGNPQLALSLLNEATGKEAVRLRGFAALLCGQVHRARADLRDPASVRLLDLDAGHRKLMADSVENTPEGKKPILRGDPIALRRRSEKLLDLAERVLPAWRDLKPLIAGPVQDALTAAIVVNLRFGEVPNRPQLISICNRTIALAPDLPSAHRARTATAWVWITDGVRNPKDSRLQGLLIADPKDWAGELIEEMRFAAYGMWFFCDPSPERVPAGELCVSLKHAPGFASYYLKKMNLIYLGREFRRLGLSDLQSGDPARVRRAAEQFRKGIDYAKRNLKTSHVELPPGDADFVQIGLTQLAAGQIADAEAMFKRVKTAKVRAITLAEIDLVRGDTAAAIRRVQPHAHAQNMLLQATLIGIHAASLRGSTGNAHKDLDAIAAWIKENNYQQVFIEWRTIENTRLLIDGKGWWPGARR